MTFSSPIGGRGGPQDRMRALIRLHGTLGSKISTVAAPVNYWNLGYTYKGALFVQSAGNDFGDACGFA
jgi:hypothetical protein